MRGFFQPWQRRIGTVLLLLACFVTGEWVRSLEFADGLGVDDVTGVGEIFLESINGRVRWYCQERNPADLHDPLPPYCGWGVMSERSKEPDVFAEAARQLATFRWGRRWFEIDADGQLSTQILRLAPETPAYVTDWTWHCCL